jgi:hypothetical protein
MLLTTITSQDLVKIVVPRFTVSADGRHFQAIADILTNLLLYSDAAHKTRSDKLETLQFRYDFTDLGSSAEVVSNLQHRLRSEVDAYHRAQTHFTGDTEFDATEVLKLRAHILALTEELNMIFDAIKLAQDKVDDQNDKKSALLLRASSSEISWRMLDERRDLLAKLAIRNIDFSWLSRQDSSIVNKLMVGDMHAFDGSPNAVWSEILSKHNEPPSHPLVKVGGDLFPTFTTLNGYNP